tara:strand:- start:4265 stop:6820 length:2556 start_codon:yes stop_codon:yes gene_type:complete
MIILIAEDDENSRVLQEVSLAAMGHIVYSASDGKEAIHQLSQVTPDVIISDIMMPEMDGFEFCRWVKSQPEYQAIPFIFYTATYVEPKDEQLGYALGADFFLIKPIEPKVFLRKIESIIADVQQQRLISQPLVPINSEQFTDFHNSVVRKKLDKRSLELESEKQTRHQSEQNYRRLVESLDVCILELDIVLNIVSTNKAWHALFSNSTDSNVTHENFLSYFSSQNKDVFEQIVDNLRHKKSVNELFILQIEPTAQHSDETIWLQFRFSSIIEQDNIIGFSVLAYNITTSVNDQKKIELYFQIFKNAEYGIVVLDANGNVLEANQGFINTIKQPMDEIVGKNILKFRSAPLTRTQQQLLNNCIKTGQPWQGEIEYIREDGSKQINWTSMFVLPTDEPNKPTVVQILTDITKMKNYQQELLYLSQHDHNTGLINRSRFLTLLDYEIKRCRRDKHELVVCFIDVDNFKDINDSYGHAVGDELINALALKLKNNLRKSDVVARFGGDEFIIFFEKSQNALNYEHAIDNIIKTTNNEFQTTKGMLSCSASMGIALFPNDSDNSADLLRNADTAMYVAKKQGKGHFAYYQHALTEQVIKRMTMSTEIKKALITNQFTMWYQPQFSIATGKISGAEALIRWQHPERGLLTPIEFLPIAESSGLMRDIDNWVIEQVFQQVNYWQKQKFNFGRVAINISTKNLKEADFKADYQKIAEKYQNMAHLIEFEIVEGAFLANENMGPFLAKLRNKGFWVSIDDFGTGYSSLSRLRSLPVDRLKIDKSFIDYMDATTSDQAIVETIISLTKSFGLNSIAEGVENNNQLELLKSLGCDNVQGYLLSRPLPVAEFEAFLIGLDLDRT